MTPEQQKILDHMCHDISIYYTGPPSNPASVTIECDYCCEVIVSAESSRKQSKGNVSIRKPRDFLR